MTARYFVQPELSHDAKTAQLDGNEAHHLMHVMRAAIGDSLVVFDGSGMEYTAEISGLHRRHVDLEIVRCDPVDREPAVPIVIGVALPKGDRQRFLIEKLVELGVARCVPLRTTYGSPVAGKAVEKLTRVVVEASKQCGRNKLMQIDAPAELDEFLKQKPASELGYLAHPRGRQQLGDLAASTAQASAQATARWFAVGPEGGFTEEEVTLASARGWRLLDLGSRILRIETAAVALASLALAHQPLSPP